MEQAVVPILLPRHKESKECTNKHDPAPFPAPCASPPPPEARRVHHVTTAVHVHTRLPVHCSSTAGAHTQQTLRYQVLRSSGGTTTAHIKTMRTHLLLLLLLLL